MCVPKFQLLYNYVISDCPLADWLYAHVIIDGPKSNSSVQSKVSSGTMTGRFLEIPGKSWEMKYNYLVVYFTIVWTLYGALLDRVSKAIMLSAVATETWETPTTKCFVF